MYIYVREFSSSISSPLFSQQLVRKSFSFPGSAWIFFLSPLRAALYFIILLTLHELHEITPLDYCSLIDIFLLIHAKTILYIYTGFGTRYCACRSRELCISLVSLIRRFLFNRQTLRDVSLYISLLTLVTYRVTLISRLLSIPYHRIYKWIGNSSRLPIIISETLLLSNRHNCIKWKLMFNFLLINRDWLPRSSSLRSRQKHINPSRYFWFYSTRHWLSRGCPLYITNSYRVKLRLKIIKEYIKEHIPRVLEFWGSVPGTYIRLG